MISGHVFLQLSSSSNHLTSIVQDNSSWQTDMRTHSLKSMASGPLKIEKGTCPVLVLATRRHTTVSVTVYSQVAIESILAQKENLLLAPH